MSNPVKKPFANSDDALVVQCYSREEGETKFCRWHEGDFDFVNNPEIDGEIKEMLKKGVEIEGSQNKLARAIGYSGSNAGCQINYFLRGRRETIPEEKLGKT